MANPDQPTAPNQRTFSLNSPEFHASFTRDRAWIPSGALPAEPRWPREDTLVSVAADDSEAADDAFRSWIGHVHAGRLGPGAGQ